MKAFFNVKTLDQVLAYLTYFEPVGKETITLSTGLHRISATNSVADVNLPDFSRSTMDGYAVCAVSTFGASEGNPAYLTLKPSTRMGTPPTYSIAPGEAARISTGGMLPKGADSVVMVEHAEAIDEVTLEVYKSVAPGQHVIEAGEDIKKGEIILKQGQRLRPQEIGLLAAFGHEHIVVYKKPVVTIISTGDEIVPINQVPRMAQIRDVNTYTLSSLLEKSGAIPQIMGIVSDDFDALYDVCFRALRISDMVLLSGGSSVGTRDFSIAALSHLPECDILVHGIAISPGKPTILAQSEGKAFWGLPGHVVSAMIVFEVVVKSFIEHISGLNTKSETACKHTALLSRNISSAQGRTDFIRVRLVVKDGCCWAEPILGKSGLIHTMVKADGLIKIDQHNEGLEKGTLVEVIPI